MAENERGLLTGFVPVGWSDDGTQVAFDLTTETGSVPVAMETRYAWDFAFAMLELAQRTAAHAAGLKAPRDSEPASAKPLTIVSLGIAGGQTPLTTILSVHFGTEFPAALEVRHTELHRLADLVKKYVPAPDASSLPS